jgi:hypoxanthine phosphoribosyltransferase
VTIAKTYISANQLLEDSFRLANHVFKSGFRPTHIIGILRGVAPIGIAVQEVLEFWGVQGAKSAVC